MLLSSANKTGQETIHPVPVATSELWCMSQWHRLDLPSRYYAHHIYLLEIRDVQLIYSWPRLLFFPSLTLSLSLSHPFWDKLLFINPPFFSFHLVRFDFVFVVLIFFCKGLSYSSSTIQVKLRRAHFQKNQTQSIVSVPSSSRPASESVEGLSILLFTYSFVHLIFYFLPPLYYYIIILFLWAYPTWKVKVWTHWIRQRFHQEERR